MGCLPNCRVSDHESDAPTEKVSLRARAEASSITPIDSSSTTTTTTTIPPPAAPVSTMLSSMISPAERSASISQAAENLTWYDPTTWPSGIAAEVTQETDSIKDSIRKMNMLSVRFLVAYKTCIRAD